MCPPSEFTDWEGNRRFTDKQKDEMADILRGEKGISKFRCGNCKWNYPNACHDPRRPNVSYDMQCKDFVHK